MTIKDIRPALNAYLLADASISSLVDAKRIYPLRLPQDARGPSIVYQRISGLGDHHMQGPSGLTQTRLQIDCWAKTAEDAVQLANHVKARLDGYRGKMTGPGSPPGSVVEVRGVFFENERESYDPAAEMYRVSRDYVIWYAER